MCEGAPVPRGALDDCLRRLGAAGTAVLAWRRPRWVAYGRRVRCDVSLSLLLHWTPDNMPVGVVLVESTPGSRRRPGR